MIGYDLKQLPSDSHALVSGYQYYIPSQARKLVKEMFGIDVPNVATCLSNKQDAHTITTVRRYDKSGKVSFSIEKHPDCDPVFKCWLSLNNQPRFTLDCEKVAEMIRNSTEADTISNQTEVDILLGRVDKPKTSRTPKTKEKVTPVEVDLSILGL